MLDMVFVFVVELPSSLQVTESIDKFALQDG